MDNTEVREEAIRWFSEAAVSETPSVGIQGKQLSALYQRLFSVPAGFIITAGACQRFLAENALVEEVRSVMQRLGTLSEPELVQASEQLAARIAHGTFSPACAGEIREAYEILNTDQTQLGAASASALAILKNSYEPPFVAVRSSPVHEDELASYPAFMNVKGIDAVIDAIRECYRVLVSPEQLHMLASRGDEALPLVAVIIQTMVDADISGTIAPKGEGYRIEAVWGLGGLLSPKSVDPDRYDVSKEHDMMAVKEVHIGKKERAMTRDAAGKTIIVPLTENRSNQQLLTAVDAQRLAKIGEMIFKVFDEPQRITFALAHGELHIIGCVPCRSPAEPSPETLADGAPPAPMETGPAPVVAQMPSSPASPPSALPPAAGLAHEAEPGGSGMIGISRGAPPLVYHPIVPGIMMSEAFQALITLAHVAPLVVILPGHLSSIRARHSFQGLEVVQRLASSAPQASLTVLVPHVTHVRHFTDIRDLAQALHLPSSISFGVQIDTPAAVQIFGKLCDAGIVHADIDLASVAQHLLGRRTPPRERELFSPAVLTALQYVHRRAARAGTHVGIRIPDDVSLSPAHLELLAQQGAYAYSSAPSLSPYLAHLLGADLHWSEPWKPETADTTRDGTEPALKDAEQAVLHQLEAEDEYQPGDGARVKADVPPLA